MCVWVWHDSFIHVTRLIHVCGTIHSYVWHDSSIWDTTYSHVLHHSTKCVAWLIHMCGTHTCDMTHSCVCHAWFIYVIQLIHIYYSTHSFVWHDTYICVAWLIHLWHSIFSCINWQIHMSNAPRLSHTLTRTAWEERYTTPHMNHWHVRHYSFTNSFVLRLWGGYG